MNSADSHRRIDAAGIEDLAQRLARAVPGLAGLRQEVEHNFRALLRAHLDRLDLVSRERFDTQADLLARTQQQLGALEARIKALEVDQARAAPGAASGDQAAGVRDVT